MKNLAHGFGPWETSVMHVSPSRRPARSAPSRELARFTFNRHAELVEVDSPSSEPGQVPMRLEAAK